MKTYFAKGLRLKSVFSTGVITNLFKVCLTEEIMNSYGATQEVILLQTPHIQWHCHYSRMLEFSH